MNIWDSDRGDLLGGARDRIDIVFGSYQSLAAGRYSAKPTIYQKTVSAVYYLYIVKKIVNAISFW